MGVAWPYRAIPVGRGRRARPFAHPENLYGREREIDTLLASFNRVVANGTFELVLVSGYSGIGNPRSNELHKVLVPRVACSRRQVRQYKRDIPYATVARPSEPLSARC